MLSRWLDLLFGKRCAICGKLVAVEMSLCAPCAAQLSWLGHHVCPFCARNARDCVCEPDAFVFSHASAALLYTGEARHLVHRYKYGGEQQLLPFFSDVLQTRFREEYPEMTPDVVTSVPMHPADRRERPFDHGKKLAQAFAASTGLLYRPLLKKVRRTERQRGLSGDKRRENLKQAFAPVPHAALAGSTILLIDDVLTTGSTLCECAKALREGGAKEVICLTLCATALGEGARTVATHAAVT